MPTGDTQIQIWAQPADDGQPRVVFGARYLAEGQGRWNFWRCDKDGVFSTCGSIHDALHDWSVGGGDSLWHDVEIVAAPASVAAKYVDRYPAAWCYEQRWWWCNSGADDKGQVGTSASLKNVERDDAIKSFCRFLRDPFVWTME